MRPQPLFTGPHSRRDEPEALQTAQFVSSPIPPGAIWLPSFNAFHADRNPVGNSHLTQPVCGGVPLWSLTNLTLGFSVVV